VSAIAQRDRFPRLDKYELLEELGHGGMATVYRARDLRLEREVAVKLIHNHLRENAEVRGRFVAEARAVAKLRHTGIVDVYDVSDDDDPERYLVVELIGGTTLRKVLDEHGAVPPEVAASIAATLCDAVQHAHEAGVIHRDIKPENVLIDHAMGSERPSSPREGGSNSGRGRAKVKLTDFGIAKVLDAQGVTSTGQILGSPAHMAPEQIEGGAIAPTTDVFALGVLLYECLVGHLPFQGTNPAQVLRRVLAGDFEPADSERAEVGGRWAAIVARALQLEPSRRYPSAADFAAAIAGELEALGVAGPQQVLDEYFAEPAAYRERLPETLVPRLVERGERARRHGDVQGAAADFNRALAMRPHDMTIIKRMSSLTSRRRWGRRIAAAACLAGGALALGGGSFAIARGLRARTADGPRPVMSSVAFDASFSEPREGTPRGMESGNKTSEAMGTAPLASPSPRLSSAAGGAGSVRATEDVARVKSVRKVRLTAVPAGAKLRVDGAEVAWFGRTQELSPGAHAVVGFMPEDNPCCSMTTASILVTAPPANDSEEIQSFTVALGFKDARVSLSGGPSNAQVSCDNGLVFGAGTVGVVKMADIQRRTTCTFMPGNARQVVTLTAGAATAVPWAR
jgi:serine/threonine protein kinase